MVVGGGVFCSLNTILQLCVIIVIRHSSFKRTNSIQQILCICVVFALQKDLGSYIVLLLLDVFYLVLCISFELLLLPAICQDDLRNNFFNYSQSHDD